MSPKVRFCRRGVKDRRMDKTDRADGSTDGPIEYSPIFNFGIFNFGGNPCFSAPCLPHLPKLNFRNYKFGGSGRRDPLSKRVMFFHCFCCFWLLNTKNMKIRFVPLLLNPFLKNRPWNHAQDLDLAICYTEKKNNSSVRPNLTDLVTKEGWYFVGGGQQCLTLGIKISAILNLARAPFQNGGPSV